MNRQPYAQSQERVQRFSPGGAVRYVRSETSSVTTNWGVNWSETLIARDIMQNFYDANRDRTADICVTVEAQDITIAAPASYNLQRLIYLGSEKGAEDVGQYGEGFKAAAVCLLRDHGVTPIAISGDQALCIRIANEPIPATQLYPLIYDLFELEKPCDETRLILPNCSLPLIKAMREGLNHFFYSSNALLGDRLWASMDGHFLIYASKHSEGHVFYRNLLRGDIPNLPLVLVINKEFKTIEDKIKNDRDRNAFGEKLMDTFYKTFARHGIGGNRQAIRILLEAGRPRWEQGHPLLGVVANHGSSYLSTYLDEATANALFDDKYFARSHPPHDPALQVRYTTMETHWEREGRVGLPSYFVKFGVSSAERYCRELDEQARQESHLANSRPPTAAEAICIHLLTRVLGQIAPEISSIFAKQRTNYTVTRTDIVLGELKRARSHRSLEVFLAERVFIADFAEALAIFLHEHTHIFGRDGDRGFSDALTELIEVLVRFRQEMDGYEAEWNIASTQVQQERRATEAAADQQPLSERLLALSETQMRDLLRRIPEVVIKRLI